MMKTMGILFILAFALVAQANDKVQTRERLFSHVSDRGINPERHYAELDLNGDGTNDLVLSESVSFGGTGGLVYNLYLGIGKDRFKKIDQFLAGIMAVETHEGTTRLWSYSHSSAASGIIRYCYFDRKGVFQKSRVLEIQPGDGGSEIGNGIYQAIFNEKTILKTETIGASNSQSEGIRR
ncbi:MAG: hypothetical protein WCP86_10220 [bacterium]